MTQTALAIILVLFLTVLVGNGIRKIRLMPRTYKADSTRLTTE